MEGCDIRSGDRVYVSPRLASEMAKMGYHRDAVSNAGRYAGKEFLVYAVWADDGEFFLTVDLCAEIPAVCCTRVSA
jgi:hypothetical protein